MRIENFDFTVNLPQVLQWERNDAVSSISLVNQKQAWYQENHTQFWLDWMNNVFNLLTADAFGLAVWSIILDVPYFVMDLDPDFDKPLWGFNQEPPINTYLNFENGNFSSNNFPETVLTLEEQRIVLRLAYFKYTTDGAIPGINVFLDLIFNDPMGILQGGAWCLDGFTMFIVYVFNCPISTALLTVLQQYDILPRPAGVKIKYRLLNNVTFGFNEQPPINNFVNFENGGFASDLGSD